MPARSRRSSGRRSGLLRSPGSSWQVDKGAAIRFPPLECAIFSPFKRSRLPDRRELRAPRGAPGRPGRRRTSGLRASRGAVPSAPRAAPSGSAACADGRPGAPPPRSSGSPSRGGPGATRRGARGGDRAERAVDERLERRVQQAEQGSSEPRSRYDATAPVPASSAARASAGSARAHLLGQAGPRRRVRATRRRRPPPPPRALPPRSRRGGERGPVGARRRQVTRSPGVERVRHREPDGRARRWPSPAGSRAARRTDARAPGRTRRSGGRPRARRAGRARGRRAGHANAGGGRDGESARRTESRRRAAVVEDEPVLIVGERLSRPRDLRHRPRRRERSPGGSSAPSNESAAPACRSPSNPAVGVGEGEAAAEAVADDSEQRLDAGAVEHGRQALVHGEGVRQTLGLLVGGVRRRLRDGDERDVVGDGEHRKAEPVRLCDDGRGHVVEAEAEPEAERREAVLREPGDVSAWRSGVSPTPRPVVRRARRPRATRWDPRATRAPSTSWPILGAAAPRGPGRRRRRCRSQSARRPSSVQRAGTRHSAVGQAFRHPGQHATPMRRHPGSHAGHLGQRYLDAVSTLSASLGRRGHCDACRSRRIVSMSLREETAAATSRRIAGATSRAASPRRRSWSLGRSVWIEDVDGRRLLDFAGEIGCARTQPISPPRSRRPCASSSAYLHQCFMVGTYEPAVDVCRRLAALWPGRRGRRASS